MKKTLIIFLVLVTLTGQCLPAQEDKPQAGTDAAMANKTSMEDIVVPTTAVLPFESRGKQAENSNAGKSFSELLFVKLLESGMVDMVERTELDKALDELHLSEVGMTSKDSQLQLGQLVGAKILIAGSVFENGRKKYAVAKIIGTETSRVVGCSASGTDDFEDLVPELASKVQAVLQKTSDKLLPPKSTVFSAADRLSTVQGQRRKVCLMVKESIQQNTPAPASEIALKKLLLALNFQIADTRAEADYTLICEAVGTSAGQFRNFSSASARVELSLYQEKGNKLLATGARKETIAGPTYIHAAKDAIEQATLRLSVEILKELKNQ